jgi:hypothetical protein
MVEYTSQFLEIIKYRGYFVSVFCGIGLFLYFLANKSYFLVCNTFSAVHIVVSELLLSYIYELETPKLHMTRPWSGLN